MHAHIYPLPLVMVTDHKQKQKIIIKSAKKGCLCISRNGISPTINTIDPSTWAPCSILTSKQEAYTLHDTMY